MTRHGEASIRPGVPDDAPAASRLLSQLGYDLDPGVLRARIRRLGTDRGFFVAVGEHGITGLTCASIREDFLYGLEGSIDCLVVDDDRRSAGIGARLLDAVEAWARSAGCAAVSVHSNVVRLRAHAFYQRHGYVNVKSQVLLRKLLSA